MKKLIALLLTIVMLFTLCACETGSSSATTTSTTAATTVVTTTASTTAVTTTEATELPIAREVLGFETAIDYLKDHLKNPSSLDVLNVRYVSTGTVAFHYEIDYTVGNSFGGVNRDTVYMSVDVTFPTEKADSTACMDEYYEGIADIFSIEYASNDARDYFNKYISDVQTMDESIIEEVLG